MGDEDDLHYKPRPFKKGGEDLLLKALINAHPERAPDAGEKEPVDPHDAPASSADHERQSPPEIPAERIVRPPLKSETPAVKTRFILQMICDAFSTENNPLSPDQLFVKKKGFIAKGKENLAISRHVAAYILKNSMGKSFQQTGIALGNRKYTTIIQSCRLVEKKMEDPVFKQKIDSLLSSARELFQRKS